MTSSTKGSRIHPMLGRLIAMLAIGLLTLSLGAATAFAGNGTQASDAADNAAPIVSSGDDQVALNEEDEDEEDEEEGSGSRSRSGSGGGGGGGGLPATDTASELSASAGSTSLVPAVAILVIAGLVGGAVKVAATSKV